MANGKWQSGAAMGGDFLEICNQIRMAKYQRFEEVPAWQAAAELYNRVLDLFEEQMCH